MPRAECESFSPCRRCFGSAMSWCCRSRQSAGFPSARRRAAGGRSLPAGAWRRASRCGQRQSADHSSAWCRVAGWRPIPAGAWWHASRCGQRRPPVVPGGAPHRPDWPCAVPWRTRGRRLAAPGSARPPLPRCWPCGIRPRLPPCCRSCGSRPRPPSCAAGRLRRAFHATESRPHPGRSRLASIRQRLAPRQRSSGPPGAHRPRRPPSARALRRPAGTPP